MTSFDNNSLRFSSPRQERSLSPNREQKDSFKRSLDREYKLLNSNRTPPKSARENRNEMISNSQFKWTSNGSKGFESRSYKDHDAGSKTGSPSFDNYYYKQELQNTRTSLKEMKARQSKAGLSRGQINTSKPIKEEVILGVDKETTKRLQIEREDELTENAKPVNALYSNVERNPVDIRHRKLTQLVYDQKEKGIFNRLSNSPQKNENELQCSPYDKLRGKEISFGKSIGHSENNIKNSAFGNSLRDWNTFKEGVSQKNIEKYELTGSQLYFTNKELVRAKYEQYEQELQRQRQRGTEKKFRQERDIQKENFVKHEYEQEVADKTQEFESIERQRDFEREVEKIKERSSVSKSREREYRSDGFQRALEKKDIRLKEDYGTIEREKGWSNRGLTYQDHLYHPVGTGPSQEEITILYPQKTLIREKILSAELEKLREENIKIQREISEIQKRNDLERRNYNSKIFKQDLKADPRTGNLKSSAELSKVKKKRTSKSKKAFTKMAKGDELNKTIQDARKNVRERLEINKEERSFTQERLKKSVDFSIQERYVGLRDKSLKKKFSAGTPQVHVRESSFLLAKGIPTSYMSNRGFDLLYKA